MAYPKNSEQDCDEHDPPPAQAEEEGAEVEYGLDDEDDPLSLAEEIAAEGTPAATRSTIATSKSSSPATPTSPNSSGCRWPS